MASSESWSAAMEGVHRCVGGREDRCFVAAGRWLTLEALSELALGRAGGGDGDEKPLGGGAGSGWTREVREATLQLSMARMRIDLREDGVVDAPESRAMVVWDPRHSMNRESQEQKVYCRLYASCWWCSRTESALLCVWCRLRVFPSNEANARGRRSSYEQSPTARWGDYQDSFATFKSVGLPCIPEAAVQTTWVNHLARESESRLTSLVQEIPTSDSLTGDVPCLEEWYSSASDFAHLRGGLQQSVPSVPPEQSKEPKPARLRRVLDTFVNTRESKHDSLGEQSTTIFKAVLRKNLDTMFIADVDVPNVLEGDLVMAALHHMQTESGIGGTSTNLRQVIFNPRLLAEDEAKMKAAPGRMIAESDRLLKSLKPSSISLTWATIVVPSFWRQQFVLTCLPDYESEQRRANNVIDMEDTPAVKTNGILQTVEKSGDPSTDPNDGGGEDASKQASHAAESHATSIASKPALKLKDVPDNEGIGTDYLLSDMFMHCNWAGESIETREERTSTPQQPDDHKLGQTLEDSLNKLARPALWELARKKLLVMRNVSMQEALATADLGKLQATICQLLGIINNIRLNPDVATHEEVVEACTSFREALWVHILRYAFDCGVFDCECLMAPIAQIDFAVRAEQQGTTANGFQSHDRSNFQHQVQASSGFAILETTASTIRIDGRVVM
jgi:hypothetical protein